MISIELNKNCITTSINLLRKAKVQLKLKNKHYICNCLLMYDCHGEREIVAQLISWIGLNIGGYGTMDAFLKDEKGISLESGWDKLEYRTRLLDEMIWYLSHYPTSTENDDGTIRLIKLDWVG